MEFDYFKFIGIVNRRIIDNLYAGIGLHVDYYYSIVDENYRPATDSTPELNTPHHYYSANNNFSTKDYLLSGISLNVIYDTRDNQINPYEGIYANINYRINPTFLGSDQNSTSLWLEFRTYLGLSKKFPRHLIGFWFFGNFNVTGKMPYLTLPSLGEDQRARSGRGYVNGRYRGMDLVYGEVEYRFPISQCSQILGGVVFVNATTTSNTKTNVRLFQYVRPAVGFGIRVMVNKHFRTNINLDFALHKDVTLTPEVHAVFPFPGEKFKGGVMMKADYHWNYLIGIPANWDFYAGARVGLSFGGDIYPDLGIQVGGR